MKILVVQNIPKESLKNIPNNFTIIYQEKDFFTKQEIIEKGAGVTALLSVFNQPVDREIIDSLPDLKIIANFGVGFNNIDIEYAAKKNIVVTNTPKPVSEPTAELTIGLIITLLRRISEFDRKLRTNKNFEWGVMKNLGSSVSGKKLGIIGMGNIGKSVAMKAKALGMNILYHNRKPISELENISLEAQYLSLNELLSQSDVVSLHVPLTKETAKMIDINELNLMKKTAFLINTSRGAVVNEKALVKHLQAGNIAGAALDVFENEPHIPQELLEMDNVVLVPHIGTGSYEGRTEIGICAVNNILAFFNGQPIPDRIV